uniref:SFRICE_005913 n=1 Tax=Spodoptera frugiperda TaxID=7108 RepID=A0A2H1VK32_SPOFR
MDVLTEELRLTQLTALFWTARLKRCLGNWVAVGFPHGTTLCVILKLLFWVLVSRVMGVAYHEELLLPILI